MGVNLFQYKTFFVVINKAHPVPHDPFSQPFPHKEAREGSSRKAEDESDSPPFHLRFKSVTGPFQVRSPKREFVR